jgi:hypothetical protein
VRFEFILSHFVYNIKRQLLKVDFGKLRALMNTLFAKIDQYFVVMGYIKQKRALAKAL